MMRDPKAREAEKKRAKRMATAVAALGLGPSVGMFPKLPSMTGLVIWA